MTETKLDRCIIFVLRVLVGWTFLYAGSWQILQNYSAAGFLTHVVTFHGLFATFAEPNVLPYTNFLMKWGHLLIGLFRDEPGLIRDVAREAREARDREVGFDRD